jgi:hypothetical protein
MAGAAVTGHVVHRHDTRCVKFATGPEVSWVCSAMSATVRTLPSHCKHAGGAKGNVIVIVIGTDA